MPRGHPSWWWTMIVALSLLYSLMVGLVQLSTWVLAFLEKRAKRPRKWFWRR